MIKKIRSASSYFSKLEWGVSPGEPQTRGLRFGAECASDLATAGRKVFGPDDKNCHDTFKGEQASQEHVK